MVYTRLLFEGSTLNEGARDTKVLKQQKSLRRPILKRYSQQVAHTNFSGATFVAAYCNYVVGILPLRWL
jgi:hypothetical protein